jgi:hypothetical protein
MGWLGGAIALLQKAKPMHTCEPPIEVIEEWLTPNGTIRGRYGHLLLELRISVNADSNSANSRTLISVIRGQFS